MTDATTEATPPTTSTASPAAESATDAKPTLRETAEGAIERAKEGATHAIEATRDAASQAAQRAGTELENNPLAVLLGGVALGLVVGALLPRHSRERELLEGVGRRLADSATSAAQAVRETGKTELEALLPKGSDAKEQLSKILGSALDAAKGAGKA